jgi:hypothetical protein
VSPAPSTQRRSTATSIRQILATTCALAACGGAPLERDDVTAIPRGDAVGSEASGDYDLELYIRDCVGRCPVIRVGVFSFSLCDIGTIDRDTITVSQQDGDLVIQTQSLLIERLAGGLYADGSFEVGGWGTQYGGEVEVIMRGDGILAGDRLSGTALSRGHGRIEDQRFDCTAVYELSGERVSW